ncbi:MAG: GNAT family N-acetyltransferase [Bacteroidales bacterium]|nr:GNAT family N-acetyltransferase [Bacteroidales bacterium]
METIKSLRGISFDHLYEAFQEAFEDYEVQWNKVQLQTLLHRRGFVPELSFGACINKKIVSFTFNGVGTYYGLKTAYDTGTGTIKEFRGRGLASRIFMHSIPFLKDAGVEQYLLEVLQHNPKAVSVYRKQGFEVSREFNYFRQQNDQIKTKIKEGHQVFQIKEVNLSIAEDALQFHDFTPSWQNSFESIQRKPEDFKVLGAFKGKKLVGYSILEPNSGDVTQIAVDKSHRRKGIGTLLLHETLKFNRHDSVKVINTEISCEPMTAFLQSNGILLKGKQFEMIKRL